MCDNVGDVDMFFFFFSSRRRHTRYWRDWSSDVCSSDLHHGLPGGPKQCFDPTKGTLWPNHQPTTRFLTQENDPLISQRLCAQVLKIAPLLLQFGITTFARWHNNVYNLAKQLLLKAITTFTKIGR